MACVRMSFLSRLGNIGWCVSSASICLSVGTCFHLWAIVSELLWIFGEQVSICVPACNSFWYLPRSEVAGPHDDSVFVFLRHTYCFPALWGLPPFTLRGTEIQASERTYPGMSPLGQSKGHRHPPKMSLTQ